MGNIYPIKINFLSSVFLVNLLTNSDLKISPARPFLKKIFVKIWSYYGYSLAFFLLKKYWLVIRNFQCLLVKRYTFYLICGCSHKLLSRLLPDGRDGNHPSDIFIEYSCRRLVCQLLQSMLFEVAKCVAKHCDSWHAFSIGCCYFCVQTQVLWITSFILLQFQTKFSVV